MTAVPDPDPRETPELDMGVPPGDTPPAESSTSAIRSQSAPPAPGTSRTFVIAISVIAVLFLLGAAGLVISLLL